MVTPKYALYVVIVLMCNLYVVTYLPGRVKNPDYFIFNQVKSSQKCFQIYVVQIIDQAIPFTNTVDCMLCDCMYMVGIGCYYNTA